MVALAFGLSINNVFDVRVMTHFVESVVLVIFGLRTIRGQMEQQRHANVRTAGAK